jgi:hypothetical protein
LPSYGQLKSLQIAAGKAAQVKKVANRATYGGCRPSAGKKLIIANLPAYDMQIVRHWKDHLKNDRRSDQDHRLKLDRRSDQDHLLKKK